MLLDLLTGNSLGPGSTDLGSWSPARKWFGSPYYCTQYYTGSDHNEKIYHELICTINWRSICANTYVLRASLIFVLFFFVWSSIPNILTFNQSWVLYKRLWKTELDSNMLAKEVERSRSFFSMTSLLELISYICISKLESSSILHPAVFCNFVFFKKISFCQI